MKMKAARSVLRRIGSSSSSSSSSTRAWTVRSLWTSMEDAQRSQILMSPPLLSLDLPDIWTPTRSSNHQHGGEEDDPVSSSFSDSSGKQSATVIDGKSIAEGIRSRIGSEVRRMKESIGKVPGLAVIMVGQRRDSQTYVSNKIKACEETGIKSLLTQLPSNCAEDEVMTALSSFNDDPAVHGILVQLPLPQHMDEEKILNMVNLEKDVDGFHPLNMGNLAMRGREPLFVPCTAKGCIELLIRSGVQITGKKAVVIGRSNIVGMPTSLLLQRHNATVSMIHEFTKKPQLITCEADIVVTGAGVPNLVRGSWLKPGAVVLDVGTCPVEDPCCEDGYGLAGDVCFDEAVQVVSAITPVPGGVGPMTVAMLLSNTLDSAKRKYNFA